VNGLLQPTRQGNIIGVDTELVVGHITPQEHRMPRASRREKDAPMAATRAHWAILFRVQAHELVFSRQKNLVRVGMSRHPVSPHHWLFHPDYLCGQHS
jgi:hypothetical protein